MFSVVFVLRQTAFSSERLDRQDGGTGSGRLGERCRQEKAHRHPWRSLRRLKGPEEGHCFLLDSKQVIDVGPRCATTAGHNGSGLKQTL